MSKPNKTPTNWPKNLKYLHSYQYHCSMSASMMMAVQGAPLAIQPAREERRTMVATRPISDKSHPANGQLGLFTTKMIPPKTHIIDYLGEMHCDDRPDSDYDLSLLRTQDGNINIGIDARVMGNEARFINDYRGVKPKPNALFVEARSATGERRISIWSSGEKIRKGDEILVSYGKSWWQARTEPHAGIDL
ncbi:SET domain protein [Infundibulicybe gibba]|nr:SET domain protein [Infundibulicybe gibba]